MACPADLGRAQVELQRLRADSEQAGSDRDQLRQLQSRVAQLDAESHRLRVEAEQASADRENLRQAHLRTGQLDSELHRLHAEMEQMSGELRSAQARTHMQGCLAAVTNNH